MFYINANHNNTADIYKQQNLNTKKALSEEEARTWRRKFVAACRFFFYYYFFYLFI
jgi:hypothetical protein